MIDTAKRLFAAHPEARFFVPLATRETRDLFEARLYAREAADPAALEPHDGRRGQRDGFQSHQAHGRAPGPEIGSPLLT